MKESHNLSEKEVESFQIKENIQKYLSYWRWFVITVLVFLFIGWLYIRYAPIIYQSTAKIKIIDDSKELDIAADPLAALAGNSSLNMDNEIEVLKSYRLLQEVVDALNLEVSYYEVGTIKTRQIFQAPFEIIKLFQEDSLKKNTSYSLSFDTKPPTITDADGVTQTLDSASTVFTNTAFPVEVRLTGNGLLSKSKSKNFEVVIDKEKETVLTLSKYLEINKTDKNSEVLALVLNSETPDLSEAILNGIISKFNQDGITDRQQVSKRTLEFIDERFVYLATELDSIEGGKEDFKRRNNLSYIEADAEISLERKAITEDEVAKLQTQISLATVLRETVLSQSEFGLLPVNIGLENAGLNTSVNNYNEMALERDRLLVTVGESHPTLLTLSSQLERAKVNIVKTVNVYQAQLRTSLGRLNQEKSSASSVFSSLPEKEKMLRSIERQQSIKENLFLLLLQKREEAAINFAVTSPSIKVVDFALTKAQPISPKKSIVYPACLLLGLLFPFGFLFIRFALDNKIDGKADIVQNSAEIPIVGEIPHLMDATAFINTNDRSVNAESFRILSTNISYLLPKKEIGKGQVILVTSTIEGEGKTQVALNLSLSYASFKKSVLLLGADLRNPQLHTNFKVQKNVIGLSDFLSDSNVQVHDCIQEGFSKNVYHNVCFSGAIPPNAAQLLSDDRFSEFMTEVRSRFDYIVVDTAPTILVADTLVISGHADVTVFVARSNFTDKRLLEFSKGLYEDKKLKNMAYVVNDVQFDKKRGYNYGYEYGYGLR